MKNAKDTKVCFIRPYAPEDHAGRLCGPQRLVADLVAHLPQGYKPISLMMARQKPSNLQENEIFLQKDRLFFLRLLTSLRKINPDIIHGHGSLNTALGLRWLKKISGKKVVLTFTDFKKNVIKNYKILNKLDAVVVQSKYAKEKLISKGVDENKVHVIVYGIEKPLQPIKEHPLIRNLGSPLVLYYGDARQERGFQLLLDALPLIRENIFLLLCLRNIHPPVTLAEIKQRVEIHKNAKILFVPEYPCSTEEIIQSSDVVVLPFIHNTLEPPLTILEVSALGKPLITTNVGGIKEVAHPRAVLLKENTPTELAQAINTYTENKMILSPKLYPWKKTTAEIKKVYDQL